MDDSNCFICSTILVVMLELRHLCAARLGKKQNGDLRARALKKKKRRND